MTDYNKPPLLKKISLFFTAGVIILLLLVFYYFFGRAIITLTPSVKPISVTFEVEVRPEADATDGSAIPGDIFAKDISLSQAFPVREVAEELPGRAHGQLTIINNNSNSQTLVAATRFLTPDNILFYLDNQVAIPAKSQIMATVTAAEEGASGNIKPPLRLTLPALSEGLQKLVYAQVQSDFNGGIIRQGRLSVSDLGAAEETLKRDIEEGFQKNYLSEYFTSKSTTTPSAAPDLLTQTQVESTATDAVAGDLVNEFTYSLTAKISGVAINRSDLEIIAQNKLKSSLQPSEQFMGLTPGSFEIKIKEITPDRQAAVLEVSLAGLSVYTQAEGFIDKSNLVGMDEAELKSYFSDFQGIEGVTVEFSPFWIKSVPRLRKNIDIKLEKIR